MSIFSSRSHRCETCEKIFVCIGKCWHTYLRICDKCVVPAPARNAAPLPALAKVQRLTEIQRQRRGYVCGWCSEEPFTTLTSFEWHLRREHPGAWRRYMET